MSNADHIAMVLSEALRIEDGRIAGIGFAAVQIAQWIERGEIVDGPDIGGRLAAYAARLRALHEAGKSVDPRYKGVEIQANIALLDEARAALNPRGHHHE